MNQFDEIHEHNASRKLNIVKGFVEVGDFLEKARQVGDIHPNGKWVWSMLPSGKYDWRVMRKPGQHTGNIQPNWQGSNPPVRGADYPSSKSTPMPTVKANQPEDRAKLKPLADEIIKLQNSHPATNLEAIRNQKRIRQLEDEIKVSLKPDVDYLNKFMTKKYGLDSGYSSKVGGYGSVETAPDSICIYAGSNESHPYKATEDNTLSQANVQAIITDSGISGAFDLVKHTYSPKYDKDGWSAVATFYELKPKAKVEKGKITDFEFTADAYNEDKDKDAKLFGTILKNEIVVPLNGDGKLSMRRAYGGGMYSGRHMQNTVTFKTKDNKFVRCEIKQGYNFGKYGQTISQSCFINIYDYNDKDRNGDPKKVAESQYDLGFYKPDSRDMDDKDKANQEKSQGIIGKKKIDGDYRSIEMFNHLLKGGMKNLKWK